jgi:glutamate-1-semialdehyde 2,1-aminomutase
LSYEQHFAFARRYLPGGVSATARANAALGHPLYVRRGDGARVIDVGGRELIDMCVSHGASLLGHAHPSVTAAVREALEQGVLCAYETLDHARLAEQVVEMVPCAELVRFAGSGTETVMHGLRLARAATGRHKVLKFEGHFHGYSDGLNYSVAPPIQEAGPPDRPIAYPESAGMPPNLAHDLVILPFNDVETLERAFHSHGHDTATLVLEPINYDSGCIVPQAGFLERCRELCRAYGVVLFFDEILTAFRMHRGGAQGYLGVTPDLCALGKAFGGGLPISALAGRRDVMEHLRPLGTSEMSGTFLAHLTAVKAARAALREYARPGFFEALNARAERFYGAFQQAIDRSGVTLRLQHVGPRFGLYFGLRGPVTNYREAAAQDRAMLMTFIAACFERGVYLAVSPHHGFSAAHTDADLMQVAEVFEAALYEVQRAHPRREPCDGG